MNKKLYIHDDAPEEIKETIRLSQQCLDNMIGYKEKAEHGTLTFEDLETMVQKNHDIIDQFPKGNPAAAGLPENVDGMKDLLALAASRQAEARDLGATNPPAYQVDSIKDLYALCQKPPQEIGDALIAAEKRRAEEKKAAEAAGQPPQTDTAPSLPPKPKVNKLDVKLFHLHLEKTVELLAACKHSYYDVYVDWPTIEAPEQQLTVPVDGLAEEGEPALDFLERYLTDEADDEDLEEKKPAAAFLMASITEKKQEGPKRLLNLFRENEALRPLVVPALKYALNPDLNDKLATRPGLEPPHVQTAIIESLQYRGVYDREQLNLSVKSPTVQTSLIKADVLEGNTIDKAALQSLFEAEEKSILQDLVFISLLTHQDNAVWLCRKHVNEEPDDKTDLPLILSSAGDTRDVSLLNHCLKKKNSKASAIRALGMLGLTDCVHSLLYQMEEEDWQVQKSIVESLELITGAKLPLSPPDIEEGPEGKEYEVKVVTGWHRIWNNWWFENRGKFQDHTRYRRGKRFDLGECINEMAYPLGNHWSRQGSYYELRLRSREFVTHFEADWYVKDQQKAIQAWSEWWEKSQHKYSKSQWLFAGET